jgi:hypothetical protein
MPAPSPLRYLRKDLAENILALKPVREGERTRVPVRFADL